MFRETVMEVDMINKILLFVAAFFLLAWGIAHLFPTNSVVEGFAGISIDNQRIIRMEWIIEGVALIFLAIILASVTYIDYTSIVSKSIYLIVALMLITLTVVSFFTGFKINFLPFKLCPVIFITSTVLILLGRFI
jgi:hypothetical protein